MTVDDETGEDPVEKSKHFDQKVTDFTWGGHQNRVIIYWLAIMMVLVFALTLFVGYNAYHASRVTQQQELLTCVSGNTVRAHEQRLWTYVFEKIEPKDPTNLQRQAFAAFEDQLHKDLKLRNCTALYG
jgi:hypothetical protein